MLESAKQGRSAAVSARDYERIAVELVRSLRGQRSRSQLSHRLGYRSNVVQRWESRRSFPSAARFLALHQKLDPKRTSCFETFFRRRPTWLTRAQPIDAEVVAAFLREPERARQLKSTWARVALERLEQAAPGSFGYALFAVSRKDMVKLRDLHLDYLRAMQQVIAASEPNECVGLYCAQLLDLGSRDNALVNLTSRSEQSRGALLRNEAAPDRS